MTKTILFVDEERYVHKALQRSFRKMRAHWNMRFVNNPVEAAKALAADPADVLITETVFSGQSGLELLKVVRDKLPHIVRIILSGYTDRDVVLKSVDLAHQYLAKPCDDDMLQRTIGRAFMMKDLLRQQSLKEAISRIDALPSLPSLYMELEEELRSEDASMQKVGEIISKDIGLTTKVLKLVNSSFFGMPQKIHNPSKAAGLLGIDLIKAIVLTSGTFDKFKKLALPGFSLEQLWDHAITTAVYSKCIAHHEGYDTKTAELIFMSGLLHDIGILLVAAHMPDQFMQVSKHMQKTGCPRSEAEISVLGTTHAGIGAYLLGLWGLHQDIIDAAAFHHCPSGKGDGPGSRVLIVHVANALAQQDQIDMREKAVLDDLDYGFLEDQGVLDRMETWRQVCQPLEQ